MFNWRSSALKGFIEKLLLVILLALVVRTFVLTSYRIPTQIMKPTLLDGETALGFRVPYGLNLPLVGNKLLVRSPQRGELVAMRFPEHRRRVYLRRVLGVAGDQLEIQKGVVKLNGRVLKDLPVQPGENIQLPATWVPEGQIFVAADSFNLDMARQSRTRLMGLTRVDLVDARLFRIWSSAEWREGDSWPRIRWERFLLEILPTQGFTD